MLALTFADELRLGGLLPPVLAHLAQHHKPHAGQQKEPCSKHCNGESAKQKEGKARRREPSTLLRHAEPLLVRLWFPEHPDRLIALATSLRALFERKKESDD
jgi:hypothetical protein